MEIPKPTNDDLRRDPLADYGESEQGKRSALWEYCPEEFRQWVRRAAHAEARVKELQAALLRLCRELQCPAMEYLNPAVQKAWGDAFDLVEPRKT